MSNQYNKASGAVKENVGSALGNEGMQQRGHEQRSEATKDANISQQQRHEYMEEAMDNPTLHKAKGFVKTAGGGAEEKYGQAVGDVEAERAGRQTRAEGKNDQDVYKQRQELQEMKR
ncbi:hypothetical protein GGI25_001907 [Coemansia spiralis]|uniref:CsbD-like domain-containing protein n=2 Tax=Coemansia TaxID=4863 RepID=A0A9W8G8W3_9FUNG|nr:hypothetical protein BX070DRAFT_143960 [Coemansia spiralis]KAJ1993340.1 hypothetical protein EDC05_002204 [Coemansia umbellata]KAJ2623511.1 hypothetical protein GGI26_002350 [Coemansia sp. RSA 1358]KAJ2678918.1 hypothetical protein GGI25_001907 [Coemansia spiralis]